MVRFFSILGLVLLGAPVLADAPDGERRLTVLFTTDLYGRFIEADCKKPPETDFSNLVGGIDRVREELQQQGLPPPLVLNGGDNIGPRAIARFLLARGNGGGRLLTGWLKRAGYELVALGNQDFFSVKQRLRAYLEEGRKNGLSFTAANLDCPDPARGLCPLIENGHQRYRMFQRGDVRIAVLSVIHGDLAKDVPPDTLSGIEVVDPVERAKQVVAAARAAGADLVIVISHLEHSETSPRRNLELARALPDADLVIANAFTNPGEGRGIETIRFADGASPVVGCDLFGEHLCRTDLRLEKRDGRLKVADLTTAEIDPGLAAADDQTRTELRQALADYCREWGKPVGQARLSKPMDVATFENYMLEIMRHATESELSFINRGTVDPRSVFPIQGSISRHDFFAGLPHRNRLFRFQIDDLGLIGLCQKITEERRVRGRTDLLFRGLDCGAPPDVPVSVNGRPLETGTRYTAITTEYLAKGVLGYFKDAKVTFLEYRPVADRPAPVMGEVARNFLRRPPFVGPHPAAIDLDANFEDLARKLRWTFDGGLNFNLMDTSISNPRANPYTESQLTRMEFVALKGEAHGRIGAQSSLHAFFIDVRSKYARSATAGADFIESEDLTTANLVYKLMTLRDIHSGWWVPIPYLEGQLETEFTRPDDDPATPDTDEDRGYHHLELTGTAGVRFPVSKTTEAKLGFGLRNEVFDKDSDAIYGVALGYEMLRTDLFLLLDSPFQMESSLSLFFGDVGRSNTLKGTWTNRLYFALVGPIFFNITHELFVYRYSTWDTAFASDLTFGLSYNARATVQTF